MIKDTVFRSKSTTLRKGDGRPRAPVNRARGAEQSKGDGDNEGGLGEHNDVYNKRKKTDRLGLSVLVYELDEVPLTCARYLCVFELGGAAVLLAVGQPFRGG